MTLRLVHETFTDDLRQTAEDKAAQTTRAHRTGTDAAPFGMFAYMATQAAEAAGEPADGEIKHAAGTADVLKIELLLRKLRIRKKKKFCSVLRRPRSISSRRQNRGETKTVVIEHVPKGVHRVFPRAPLPSRE